ncbi:MAG TPA: flagellin [Firmicutes bacterium]|nr:flagellin [Candidatus Fermentithermobacillaceae bacterium]
MRINTNISALNAWKNLTVTDTLMAKSLEKLSSGYRINRAADDAAGLAISEKMRAQVTGLRQAVRNAQDGISLIQTAEGALNETHSILQRMRELAAQAASETMTPDDRSAIAKELNSLVTELDRIANTTEFNTKKLLDGTFTNMSILIGANTGTDNKITFGINAMTSASLGVSSASIDVSSVTFAEATIGYIDSALKKVSEERAGLGALQNRLEHTINNLNTAAENLAAAESRIRDVDMALEMANFTRHQILLQAGTAMLAQANVRPQSVLKLLG